MINNFKQELEKISLEVCLNIQFCNFKTQSTILRMVDILIAGYRTVNLSHDYFTKCQTLHHNNQPQPGAHHSNVSDN